MISIDKNKKLYKQEGKCGAFQVMLPYMTAGQMMRKYLPDDWGEGFLYCKGNYLWAVFYEKIWEDVSRSFFKKYFNKGIELWRREWSELDKKLTEASQKVSRLDVSELSLEELRKNYDEVYRLDLEMWACGIFIDSFDIGVDQVEIERISKEHNIEAGDAQALMVPDEPSFITEWDRSLLDYRQGIIQIEQLKNNFFWYGMDYSTFRQVDDSFVESSLKTLDSIKIPVVPDKKAILEKYHLKSNPLAVFALLTLWRDERKRLNYTGLYGLLKILREVARRQNIKVELVNMLIPEQINDFFEGKTSEAELIEREEVGFFVHVDPNGAYTYHFGAEGNEIWKTVTEALHYQESLSTEVKGSVASKGTVVGKVKIILNPHADEAKKMNVGDILVTSMTRPEFLPFMKIAGAFVTDEGGISSHAAIVAREMKKPCIIGTKIATKVLKDGMTVEVDANTGTVKILKDA